MAGWVAGQHRTAGGVAIAPAMFSAGGGAPTAPTGLSATVTGGTTATLTWVDASSDETGFVVQVDSGGGYVNASGAANPTASGVQTFSATGLAAATTYAWRVGAVNGSGTSYTVGASFTTDNPGSGGGTIPVDLTAAACSQSATSGTGAIAQTHNLAAAGSTQSATSGTGAIGVPGSVTLAASSSIQSATSGTGAITQTSGTGSGTVSDIIVLDISFAQMPVDVARAEVKADVDLMPIVVEC